MNQKDNHDWNRLVQARRDQHQQARAPAARKPDGADQDRLRNLRKTAWKLARLLTWRRLALLSLTLALLIYLGTRWLLAGQDAPTISPPRPNPSTEP